MFRRTFKIIYRPMKNNFILLPENYYNLVSSYENGTLSLTFGRSIHYTTWVPYVTALKETEIGINAKLAKQIGLKENDLVKCALISNAASLRSVHVTPASAQDWEMIELSSEKLELTVLDQVKIVSPAQPIVIWLNKSIQVTLLVDRIKPNNSFGRIENNTEFIVAPNLQKRNSAIINGIDPPAEQTLSRSKTIANIYPSESHLSRSKTTNIIQNKEDGKQSAIRVNQLEKYQRLIKDLKRELCQNFQLRIISGKWEDGQISDIFITKNNLPELMDLNQNYLLCTGKNKEYYVNIKLVAQTEHFPNNIYQTVEINENLMKLLELKDFEKVTLTSKQIILNFIEKIELFAHKKTNYKIVEQAFKKYVLERTKLFPLLLNQNQVLRLEDDLYVTVEMSPRHLQYCSIDGQILKESKVYAADEVRKVDDLLAIETVEDERLRIKDLVSIQKYTDIVNEIIDQIKISLCLDERNRVLYNGNVLISGQANCGKSIIVERILHELNAKPICCYYDIYYCTQNKGRKPESIQKDLQEIFISSLCNSPSIVVLENLDVLAQFANEHQPGDGEYFNRVADVVYHMLTQFTYNSPIRVIATVNNVKSLNRRLYTIRGRHLFHTVVNIPELERDDRRLIIESLCQHINFEKIDFTKFANLTEGYTFGDLVQFVERAIFYAYRINQSAPVLRTNLLFKSLENTSAYCLPDIENTYKNNEENESGLSVYEKLPGLEDVITALEEVIIWPVQYPNIFNNAPIRIQSGVLLFGPPGTGKTFLVSQISSLWNLRVISIKGPELLAKYIGQSEENVRNLFTKARNAKPCILFFDEFDSLAPKRGHDSTGVTDRVVNQLLTELDGVELLQGVTVIAATSRPELIDSALLRCGRLGRLVEFPLPNREARQKTFQVLSNTLHLDKSVDFGQLADKTELFTGADIKSILTTANMAAVKEVLAKFGEENLPDKIFINQIHLMDALANTRPSLSKTDIARYKQMYARFTKKEKQPRDFVAKRATLA